MGSYTGKAATGPAQHALQQSTDAKAQVPIPLTPARSFRDEDLTASLGIR
jgi:hypothetical protein